MKRLFLVSLLTLAAWQAFAGGCACRRYQWGCPDCGKLYLSADIGGFRFDMPHFSFGQIIIPETISIVELESPKETMWALFPRLALGVEINNPWNPCYVGCNWVFEVAGFYVTTDRHTGPGNGEFESFALPRLNGSGDLIADTSASNDISFSGVQLSREYVYAGVEITLGSQIFFDPYPCFSLTPFVEFDADSVQQTYKARIGGISSIIDATNFCLNEKLNTNYYDFGVGLNATYNTCADCRGLLLFGEATVKASTARTYLNGSERIFIISSEAVRRSSICAIHDAFSLKARGEVGVGYQFGSNFAISCVGQVDYWGYLPRLVNPKRVGEIDSSGIYDRPAHIERTTALTYAIFMNITMKLF